MTTTFQDVVKQATSQDDLEYGSVGENSDMEDIDVEDDLSLDGDDDDRPSNEKLLCTAFLSFMTFAIVQSVAAVFAGSEAMMGDSAAMVVDAFTYLFNLLAERKKATYRRQQHTEALACTATDREAAQNLRLLRYRRYNLQLELIPPLISVSTLLTVTGIILHQAITLLILDSKRDESLQSFPNLHLMIFFSFLNLLLDGLNVFCFAKAKHALGFNIKDDKQGHEKRKQQRRRLGSRSAASSLVQHDELSQDSINGTTSRDEEGTGTGQMEPLEIEEITIVDSLDEDEHANLNMCSAYTHVFADTLRTFAVIIAVIFAEFTGLVTPEEADASAAIVVSFVILLGLIPLLSGLIQTISKLRRVKRREETEKAYQDAF